MDESLIIVDLDACERENEINASYFFNNVQTIILETNENALIGELRNFIVHNNFIIAFDNSEEGKLFIFYSDGRFSHKIGNKGGGPGEYFKITDFSLDKEKNEIYILDRSANRILKYKLYTGEFISSIRYKVNRFPASIQYFDNNLYIDACDIINNDKELLYKINKEDGSEICSWLDIDIYNCEWMDAYTWEDGFFLSRYAENPKYVSLFMDTVMSIGQTGIKPFLVVNSQKWVRTKDFQDENYNGVTDICYYMQKKNKSFGISKLIEIQDAIFFNLVYDNNFCFVFKSPKETRLFTRFVDDMVYTGDQFVINNMICSDDKGVYAISYPLLFADYTGQTVEDILKENLGKREELIQLPEDSNPVIFYYEYKR